jgi:adenosyl cobinamide kinase/adenosyl cobinamide phosphate guanylyltransferase
MQITETNDLRIYPTKQSIDKPLGLPAPFADRNSVFVVTGGQGSGKSTWLNSALTCRKADGKIFSGCYHNVFYATPEECFTSEEDHPFKNHVKSRLFHVFNADMLNNIVEQALELKHEKKGNSILVIDDFSEELKNPQTINLLKKIINKHRHYHLSILISTLSMKSIPKGIRALIDYFVIFKPKGLIELEGYTDEIFGVSKREMKDIMEFVYDGDHNFLLYNNKKGYFYKNFDRFTIAST